MKRMTMDQGFQYLVINGLTNSGMHLHSYSALSALTFSRQSMQMDWMPGETEAALFVFCKITGVDDLEQRSFSTARYYLLVKFLDKKIRAYCL
jgi:hypothetical protein